MRSPHKTCPQYRTFRVRRWSKSRRTSQRTVTLQTSDGRRSPFRHVGVRHYCRKQKENLVGQTERRTYLDQSFFSQCSMRARFLKIDYLLQRYLLENPLIIEINFQDSLLTIRSPMDDVWRSTNTISFPYFSPIIFFFWRLDFGKHDLQFCPMIRMKYDSSEA